MGFLGGLLGGISGASSLLGLISGQNGVGSARRQQEQAISDYQRFSDADINALLGGNNRDLYAQSGLGQDAILSSTRGLGDELAAGGVYNSSTVAGANTAMHADLAAALARYAAEQNQNAARLKVQAGQNVAGMKLNLAGQNYNENVGNRNNAQNSMYSLLGSLTQQNLNSNGATRSASLSMPLMNGTLDRTEEQMRVGNGIKRTKLATPAGRLGMRLVQPSLSLGY